MKKLSRGKVEEIVQRLLSCHLRDGRSSVGRIAKAYGVTPRWIREIRRRLLSREPLPLDRPLGRPPARRFVEEEEFILSAERQYQQHPGALERILETLHGVHIPHTRIHQVLKAHGMVTNTPSQQERRKPWIRFERKHSNSLWQMDFTQLGPGRYLLVIIDDASRLIVGHAETKAETAELVWETFRASGARYGFPRQILTDHGTQFTKKQYGGVSYLDRRLRALRLKGIVIQHITGRVKHPQTGGKVERVNGTLKAKLRARWPEGDLQFPGGIGEIVPWYNRIKPHMSLRFEESETPARAFVRKLRPNERRAYLKAHPEEIP